MSELKAYCPYANRDGFYHKSEADKVIATLTDKANYYERAYKNKSEELADICRFYEDELRHANYKRCLAMAERCKDKIENVVQYNEHDDWLIITEYWERWHKRWLALAEEPTWAKFLQLIHKEGK